MTDPVCYRCQQAPCCCRDRQTVYCGDSRVLLQSLPDACVQTVVTSPPYYGLRDYGTGEWVGGDPACSHSTANQKAIASSSLQGGKGMQQRGYKNTCPKCGATRVDDQIGLEQTPEAYVAELVALFREVRRVLRPDGTLWLNLGDSWAGGGEIGQSYIKSKDLIGIPWMVAFALRADGWHLRSEIIWHKPAAMPESAKDRPSKAHEQVFLLSKSPRYFYDWVAIAERAVTAPHAPGNRKLDASRNDRERMQVAWGMGIRNRRSVWSINPQPYKGAHFAVFPQELARQCILAGSAEKSCAECGAPWVRQVASDRRPTRPGRDTKVTGDSLVDGNRDPQRHVTDVVTVGFAPGCGCQAGTVPSLVLDPFGGSGTVAVVARDLGRRSVLCELSDDHCQQIKTRLLYSGLF